LTYYFVISLGATLSVLWFLRRGAGAGLSGVRAIDLALVVLLGGFIGARLLHVFYEEPDFYRQHPLRVLEFWYGGFVYLGGLFGAALSAALFCEWRREPFWVWADLAAPPAALAYAIGRVGCFFNGCCYGRHCDLPWAVWMDGDHRHPTQLYATFGEGLTLLILLTLEPRLRKKPGALFGLWLVLHGAGRIVMEHFRDDPRGPLLYGFSISTWISAALMGAGLALFSSRVVPRLQRHSS
jgi:phosphatidylglycerol:prolipoprotein diacylglycerol transferase